MKLPWDKDYLKISFHVIFTLIMVFALGILLQNIFPILKNFFGALGYIFSVLAPLWVGFIVAYLLDPLANYFQKKYEEVIDKNQNKINSFRKKIGLKSTKKEEQRYKSRGAGAGISYIVVITAIIIVCIFISYSLGGTGNNSSIDIMVSQITEITNKFIKFLDTIEIKMKELGIADQSEQIINELINTVTSFTQGFGSQIIGIVSKTGSYAINFILGIVIGFYFIKDKDMLLDKVRELSNVFIPKKINGKIKTAFSDIDAIFSGYIRGQLTDATIMAVLIALSLSIIGIDLSVLIGIIAGFSNVIPYVGAFVGLALAMLVGLLSGTPIKAVYALIVMLILQQVDSAIIVPKVVGNQVDLHPILVLLALSVGGAVFGIVGMILAVPVTAIFKIFLMRYFERKKKQKQQKI